MSKRHLALARQRLGQLSLVLGALVCLDSPLFAVANSIFRNPEMMAELIVLSIYPLALDLALFFTTRNPNVSDEGVVRFGLVYHVLRCAALALFPVRLEAMLGLTPPAVTFVCAAVICFPVVVPIAPRQTLLVSLCAAATQPLALLVTAWAHPPSQVVYSSVLAAAMAVAVAVLCGRVAYGLTKAATESSEAGPYQLLERIGTGAFGDVWLAKHRLLSRLAAVKTIRASHLESKLRDDTVQRFEREAQITSGLTSPHTVTVYDYGVSADGFLYYVMEFLEGENLESYVRRHGALSPRSAVQVALEICDSLGEAHELGLVHRDLKPANLFRARIGRRVDFTKILDFGLAGLRRRLDRRTHERAWATLRVSGTPAYLPPELLVGGPLDQRADIYQLGCVLYFLLSGQVLFSRESIDKTIYAHLREEPPSLVETEPQIPVALERAVLRCLAKRPEDRFANVRELERALNEVRDDLDRVTTWTFEYADAAQTDGESGSESALGALPSRTLVFAGGAEGGPLPPPRAEERAPTASPEMLDVARTRVAHFAWLVIALTVVGTPLWLFFYPSLLPSHVLQVVLWAAMAGLALDIAMLRIAQASALSSRKALWCAVGYFVLRGALFSVSPLQTAHLLGLEPPRMTLPLLFALILPVFVPFDLKKLFFPIMTLGLAQEVAMVLIIEPDVRAPIMADSIGSAMIATVGGLFLCLAMTRQRRQFVQTETMGAYTLERLIGHGAMGEVWQARHQYLARPAAIKLLQRPATGEHEQRSLRRFAREARITASLTSAHTVTLYDYGISRDGTLYYVMQLLKGLDLDRLVRTKGPLSPREAVRVTLSVCDSLGEAHARGLIHRDLKPANIFSADIGGRAGFIKVLDFGLAVPDLREANSVITERFKLLGTPAYMSPEQFLGERVTIASDVYALGCVLYFTLTGRAPFERESISALAVAHIQATPPVPSEQSPYAVPPALDAVVMRCLAKVPSQRFASGKELAEALERISFGDEASWYGRDIDALAFEPYGSGVHPVH